MTDGDAIEFLRINIQSEFNEEFMKDVESIRKSILPQMLESEITLDGFSGARLYYILIAIQEILRVANMTNEEVIEYTRARFKKSGASGDLMNAFDNKVGRDHE